MELLGALEGIFLFVLAIPIVMKYRILPIDGTPYWLFGILFGVLVLYILQCLYRPRGQSVLFWIAISISFIGVILTAMVDRNRIAPEWGVHDVTLQQEAAMRYLLVGKNPYKETYFGTPVEDFHYDEMGRSATNPALYHFVMPPWYLIFPFAFYYTARPVFGFFDGRMVLLFCVISTWFIYLRWFNNTSIGRLAVLTVTLAPGVVDYIIEGRSDGFSLFWLTLSLFLVFRKRLFLSAVVYGLALMSKQTVWFSFPLFGVLVYHVSGKSFLSVVKHIATSGIVVALLVLPFFLWDAYAFIDSTFLYLSGGGANSYPISGYGWGMVLYELGIVKDIHAYHPFVFWQVLFGVPTIFLTARWFIKKVSASRFWIAYGLTLVVFWYFSRYFNNSHSIFVSTIFALGGLFHIDELLERYAKKT